MSWASALPPQFALVLPIRVFALQRAFQPVLDTRAPDSLHGGDAGLRGPRDLRVAPASFGALDVGQKQDASMALAVCTGLAFAQNGFKLRAFFGAQSDVMLFVGHRIHLYTDKNSTRLFFRLLPSPHD